MSGKNIEEARKRAAEIQNDPAIPLIKDLGEAMEKSVALIEGEHAAYKRVVEDQFADVKKLVETTRTEMAIGQKVHADRINTLDRRSVALGLSGPRDIEGVCLAALGDEQRQSIPVVGMSIPARIRDRRDEFPLMSSPVGGACIAHWLYDSFLIQKRRFRDQREESAIYGRMEKYEKAFKELFPHEVAASLTSTDTALGGAWLPDPVAAELYRLILDNSIIAQQCTHVPMTTKTLELPVEGSSSLNVSWGTENVAITDSVPASNATSKITLTANRLNGRAIASMEEIQDSPISILSWVQTKLTEMAGRAIDLQALEGTGSPFTGLSNATGVVDAVVGANGDLVTYASLVALAFAARERASREGAKFFVSPEIMGKIVGLVDNNGQPIVQFGNVPNAFAAAVIGFPVEVHSAIRADRTYGTGTGGSNVYFGPPRQIVIGDRQGMAWDVSDIPGFSTAEVHMRLIARLGLGVAVPKSFARHLQMKAV